MFCGEKEKKKQINGKKELALALVGGERSPENVFRPFGPQFGLKISGGGGEGGSRHWLAL